MSGTRHRGVHSLLIVLALLGGCTEWLEMPIETPPTGLAPESEPTSSGEVWIVARGARANAPGPLVPRTPGLRVPEGFWTRVRMDTADAWMPYSWADLRTTTERSQQGEGQMTLRLLATGRPGEGARVSHPSLRVVAPVAVPPGTRLETLVGLTLQTDALSEGVVGFDLGGDHPWMVKLDKLTLMAVTPSTVSGTMEGTAVRGSKARKSRPFQAAFHALRVRPDKGR